MAGAVPATSLGVGFVVSYSSPKAFLRESHNGSWYLCDVRPNTNWAEIIAEFRDKHLADIAFKAHCEHRGIPA